MVQTAGRSHPDLVVRSGRPGSRDDGIRVGSDTTASVVAQNTVFSNGGDGIEVSYATVTRNIATYNAQLGIRALAGVIDGGGNKAADNGDPDQCEGLACTMP